MIRLDIWLIGVHSLGQLIQYSFMRTWRNTSDVDVYHRSWFYFATEYPSISLFYVNCFCRLIIKIDRTCIVNFAPSLILYWLSMWGDFGFLHVAFLIGIFHFCMPVYFQTFRHLIKLDLFPVYIILLHLLCPRFILFTIGR